MRCHYEVLGVEKSASEDEIRRAYKKLAVRLHPDKAMQRGEDVVSANERFRELQGAYECLVDSRERSWYDTHRDDILRGGNGGSSSGSDDDDDEVDDHQASPASFWAVYGAAFEKVEDAEEDSDYRTPFGDSSSSWEEVKRFYDRFVDFRSDRSFAAYDRWKIGGDEPRNVRRAADADNKRRRKAAKAQYQDMVSQLALWCRKRDPRIAERIARLDREKKEKEAKKADQANARRQENLLARQRWREENSAAGEDAAFEAYEVRSGVTLNDLEDDDRSKSGRRSKKKKGKRRSNDTFFDDHNHRETRTNQTTAAAEEQKNGNVLVDEDLAEERGTRRDDDDHEQAREAELAATVTQQREEDEETVEEDDDIVSKVVFACDLCKKTFKSEKQMDNHLQSKAHRKKAGSSSAASQR